MLIIWVSRVESHLLTHLSKLAGYVARFTVAREDSKEGLVAGDQQQSRADHDLTGSRERRVNALKDLVAERDYDVPAEEVAARIILDAIVIAPPTPQH
jgi:anti-sigma28 factor (negative regulator of flagellin synthesis)